MTSQDNVAVVIRWLKEAILGNRPELVDELFPETIIVHGKRGEKRQQPREERKAYIAGMHAKVENASIVYDDPPMFGDGEFLAARWVTSGTSKETGETKGFVHNYLYRIRDGRIIEEWQAFF